MAKLDNVTEYSRVFPEFSAEPSVAWAGQSHFVRSADSPSSLIRRARRENECASSAMRVVDTCHNRFSGNRFRIKRTGCNPIRLGMRPAFFAALLSIRDLID
jgi:hypothetical protein